MAYPSGGTPCIKTIDSIHNCLAPEAATMFDILGSDQH